MRVSDYLLVYILTGIGLGMWFDNLVKKLDYPINNPVNTFIFWIFIWPISLSIMIFAFVKVRFFDNDKG